MKTGYTNPASESTLAKSVTATVTPKESVSDVTFRMAGAQDTYAELGTVTRDATAGTATFDVKGKVQSSNSSVTKIEAVCNSNVVGSVIVKVVVPKKIMQPYPQVVPAAPPGVAVNKVGDSSTTPVWYVPGDPPLGQNEVGLASTWYHVLTIMIEDQFGDLLDSIYDGAKVEEKLGDNWVNINAPIASGSYQDPVGVWKLRAGQYVFNVTVPAEKAIVDAWPTEDLPNMPLGTDNQSIAVKVAGFAVGTIVRRVISTSVGGVDKIEIQWPPQ